MLRACSESRGRAEGLAAAVRAAVRFARRELEPELVEFVLTPYVGSAQARRLASAA